MRPRKEKFVNRGLASALHRSTKGLPIDHPDFFYL